MRSRLSRNLRLLGSARWIVGLVVVLAVGLVAWIGLSRGWVKKVYRDGGTLHIEGDKVHVRKILWERPTQVADAPEDVTIAPIGPPIVVSMTGPMGDRDIFLREPTAAGWTEPVPLETARSITRNGAVNSPADEISPCIDPLGRILVFASNRAGGLGDFDLWVSEREADGWGKPRNLGPTVNSPYHESDPALLATANVVAFATNRPRGFLFSPPASWEEISLDLWPAKDSNLAYCVREKTKAGSLVWSKPIVPYEINTPADETNPSFSPAGEFLYFASDRSGGSGGFDLWRCRRDFLGRGSTGNGGNADAGALLRFESPENLGTRVNSADDETAPILRDGGFRIVFQQSRTQEEAGHLFSTRSREVEEEIEIASLPLRAFAENVGRLVLATVLAIVFAIAAVMLYRTRRSWAVNVLTACFIVALLIHAGIGIGFYFWPLVNEIVAYAHVDPEEEITLEESIAAKIAIEVMSVATPVESTESAAPLTKAQKIDAEAPAEAPSVEVTEATIKPPTAEQAANESTLEPAREDLPDRGEGSLAAVEKRPPSSSESRALPVPKSADVTPEPDIAPKNLRTTSEPQDVDPSQTATVKAVELTVDSPSEPGSRESSAQLAKTSVQAPVESKILPPVARAEPTPVANVAKLPVPAQSPSPDPSATPQEPSLAKHSASGPQSLDVSSESTRPTTQPTELALPKAKWEAMPVGLKTDPNDRPAEEMFVHTPLPTRARPDKVASSRSKLPEAAAFSERTTAASGSTDAQAGPRRLEKIEHAAQIVPATLKSKVATVEERPLTAPDDRAAAVSEAAMARLDPTPSPGLQRPISSPHSRPFRVPDRRLLPEGTAEETGDIPRESENGEDPEKLLTRADDANPLRSKPRDADASLEPHRPSVKSSDPTDAAKSQPVEPLVTKPALDDSPLDRDGPESGSATGLEGGGSESPSAPRIVARLRRRPGSLPEEAPEVTSGEKDLRATRAETVRDTLVAQGGGNDESEAAVKLALDWLARHQSPVGYWDVDGFDGSCKACRSPGYHKEVDAAVTGLTILAFLGQNHTPQGGTEYSKNVKKAIEWLLSQQKKNGNLSGKDERFTMYSHGIATLAVSEAYLMTRDEKLRAPLQRAIKLIIQAQNPRTGGWRYQPKPPIRGDTSISGWQVMALSSARGAGLEIPEVVFDRCRHWLDVEVAGGESGGIYGYSHKEDFRPAMVAEGLFSRQVLGGRRGDASVEESARYLATKMRKDNLLDNLYLLYYGNLALYQYQGWIWESWNTKVRDHLVKRQHKRGPRAGSWSPTGPYSSAGGRVLATAFATLTLEVYYRYLPLYWAPAAVEGR